MIKLLQQSIKTVSLLTVCILLSACTGIPDGISPVKGFELSRFTGTWYEVARLDHSFEQGLSQVTADYSVAEDGTVTVLNKGFSNEENEWSEAEGKAKFIGDTSTAHLKVSFFGPFYSSYIVFKLDQENYQYAYITGYNRDYLWLLSRTKKVSEARKKDFIKTAKAKGFDVDQLIFVEQK